jgi:hypothetical protein
VSSRTACEDLFPHVICLRKLAERRKPRTSVCLADLEFPRLLTDAGWYVQSLISAMTASSPLNGP